MADWFGSSSTPAPAPATRRRIRAQGAWAAEREVKLMRRQLAARSCERGALQGSREEGSVCVLAKGKRAVPL